MMNSQPLPLDGLTVAVTRPEAQDRCPLTDRLQALGARTIPAPAIRLDPPADWNAVDDALGRIDSFQSVVFLSRNAVRYFSQRAHETGQTEWTNRRLVAIGAGTAASLNELGLPDVFQPDQGNSHAMAQWLVTRSELQPILIVRADRGSDILARTLNEHGFEFVQIATYRSVDADSLPDEFLTALSSGDVDWVTVTSPAIAANLIRLAWDHLSNTRIAAISPAVASVIEESGSHCHAVARRADFEALVQAMIEAVD